MSNEEKFKAIIDRLKMHGWFDTPEFISVFMIIHYMQQLQQKGVIECAFTITDSGKNIISVCEEFDWKPSDNDIYKFVNEMIDESDRLPFIYLIKQYRDNKDSLLKEIDDNKSSQ